MSGWRTGLRAVALGAALPAALLLLWQVAADQRWIDPLFYPPPSRILDRTFDQVADGSLLTDTWITTRRLLLGFVLGAAPGIAAGLGAGVWRAFRETIYPLASALYVVPRIAMLPLVLVAFSIGDEARVFMVAFSVFFIAFFSALSGAEQVSQRYLDVARAFGASRARTIARVVLPGAAPSIATGLQVAMGFALIVIVGTEFLAANTGLGARIWTSYQVFDFPSMYAGIVGVTVLGVVLNYVILAGKRWLVPWQR
ncbi:MAG: ABC transporter permease [Dehalococcoidia bacterium]|nr:ABC transporter permease [Dehalococcoidia bacterium]